MRKYFSAHAAFCGKMIVDFLLQENILAFLLRKDNCRVFCGKMIVDFLSQEKYFSLSFAGR